MVGKYLQLSAPSEVRIRVDPDQLRHLRREEVEHLAYHFARLLTGQETARMEWEHLGIEIRTERW